MTHNCMDWTVTPPTRKIPLLILTHGDDHVYTIVPKELKTLEDVARREFNLGDVEIKISSSCLNLCNGLPARITESAWEHVSPYIGCANIEVSRARAIPPQGVSRDEQPTVSENIQDERDSSAKRKLPSNTDEGDENEQSDLGLGGKGNTSAREAVRDEQSGPSGHGNDHDGASAPEDQHEEPWEEEASAIPRKPQNRRRVVSEHEDEGEESEREHEVLARSQVPLVASPPKPTQSVKEVKKERDNGHRSQPDLQSAEPLHQPSKPIKQEKRVSGGGSGSQPYSRDEQSQPQSQYEIRSRAESNENHKLLIRVAHRPSKQESKFTTKSTTRVAKVLAGACKSFGLDADRATLYLIVSMEDEDGEVENLFPCDMNDTIARAGAEHNTESRFLLKIAGEA